MASLSIKWITIVRSRPRPWYYLGRSEDKEAEVLQNLDPRLIRAQIESIQSVIKDLSQDARGALAKIEVEGENEEVYRQIRRSLVSVMATIDLMNNLLIIALDPYLQELDEREKDQAQR
ncbi:MAG: hypothetical protein BMS9Abin34_107 [Patescibacteria group bacterium]|nr:MAG: hypothetical protein BMS9Abin34_107 [Patescibacteria group bacterium]